MMFDQEGTSRAQSEYIEKEGSWGAGGAKKG